MWLGGAQWDIEGAWTRRHPLEKPSFRMPCKARRGPVGKTKLQEELGMDEKGKKKGREGGREGRMR